MRAVVLIIGCWLCSLSAVGQSRSYAIVLLGDTIGKSFVNKKDSAGCVVTTLSATSKAKILMIERSANVKMYQVKKNGILQYSYFHNLSESEEITITTQLKGDTTYIYKNNQLIKKIGKIAHTVLDLYFSAPQHHKYVFAERLMSFVKIAVDENNNFFTQPESGQTNTYFYNKNGLLTSCKIKKGFGTMYFILR